MALLAAAYGDLLRRHLVARERLPATVRALLLVALTLAVFWDTERLAGAVGSAYAARIAANPSELVSVTIYSPKRLWIALPEVTETRLDRSNPPTCIAMTACACSSGLAEGTSLSARWGMADTGGWSSSPTR